MTTNHKPATALPSLARLSGERNPFTVLGAIVPSGAPMRALIQIQDERARLVEALQCARRALIKDGHRPGLSAPLVETIDPLLRELGKLS